ncbi:MAG TPA: class E sortase [Jatrophihabitantaceae bacterium]
MTITDERPAEAALESTAAPAAEPAPPRRSAPPIALRRVASILSLVVLLIFGFLLYLFGLSRLSEAHTQNAMYKTFKRELDQAVAPVGPTGLGRPVAVLDIPAIGLHEGVVVEGTDSRQLTKGPGHRRDTPLPGQAGVSVVYGRRSTFGAPFAHLMRLNVGDPITVTTGQGVATYVVSSFGDRDHPAPANSDNRLVLTTADSSTVAHSTVSVSADLRTAVQPSPGGLPAIAKVEDGLKANVDASLIPLLLWSQVLLLTSIVGTVAAYRWSRWPAYLCFVPVAVAATWNVYENAAALLPNLY